MCMLISKKLLPKCSVLLFTGITVAAVGLSAGAGAQSPSQPLCGAGKQQEDMSALHRKIINTTSAPAAIGPYR